MKTKCSILLLSILTWYSTSAFSEPTSGYTQIRFIRPYIGDNRVYIGVTSNIICQTDTFSIDLGKPNGKAAYAASLAAQMANKRVALEIVNDSCTGYPVPTGSWGTELRSVYVVTQ